MAAKFTSKVKSKNNLSQLMLKLKSIQTWEAEAGYDDTMHPEAEITYAFLAWIHENGVSQGKVSIPQRPFITQAFQNDITKVKVYSDIIKKTIYQKASFKSEMKKLSLKLSESISDAIQEGNFEPLSSYTVKRKGHARPLIESGSLKDNVKHWIKKKGA